MNYFTQQIIASCILESGIKVIVREGLNNKNDWELRLEIPKHLHELWNRQSSFIYDVIHTKQGDMYFAEDPSTGRVRYFFYSGPSNGFGGYVYKLPMKDGSIHELTGPWSSNSHAMNMVGHKPSKEVNIDSKYNMADAMTIDAINELLKPLDMECILVDNDPVIIRL